MNNYTLIPKDQAKVIIDNGVKNGLKKEDIVDSMFKKGMQPEGIDPTQWFESRKPKTGFVATIKDIPSDIGGFIKDTVQSSSDRAEKLTEAVKIGVSGEQGLNETLYQAGGQLAGAGADAIGNLTKAIGKAFLSPAAESKANEWIGKVGQEVVQNENFQKAIKWYDGLDEKTQRNLDATGGFAALASEFIGGGVAGEASTAVKKAGGEVLEETVAAGKRATQGAMNVAGDIVSIGKAKVISALSPDVEDSVKRVLENVPTEKFDEFAAVAEKAASDTTAPSTFENVANRLTTATKDLSKQTEVLAAQKRQILELPENGMSSFKDETVKTIADVTNKIPDKAVKKKILTELKKVKTKLDADEAIDNIQDILYTGSKDMTIPQGSKTEKILKRIIGEYNSKLKSSLPKEYAELNAEISNRIKATNILNRALGETIDGVPVRGASLVKQFFSPAGTKAKKLFEFIKVKTGVDIAEDAVLAKYVAEAFGDVKTRSLLEGLPTSKSGAIDKTIEFVLDKTGISGAFNEAKRAGILEKGRILTKNTN